MNVRAQNNYYESPQKPSYLVKSPNTAILDKFGDYDVSLFSGVPNISIPLYTIKSGGLEIPISLVYHASGIRIYDYPSWVGSGWALDVGGNVSRQLVGLPDEIPTYGYLSGATRKSLDLDPYQTTSGASADYNYLVRLNKGEVDFGADIYSYNLPGMSGKFYFDTDSSFSPVLIPYSPVKIERLNIPGLGFRVFDQGGNQFSFYDTEVSSFWRGDDYGGRTDFYTSSWVLNSIVSATKLDTISFSYSSQSNNGPYERSDTWVVDDYIDNIDIPSGGCTTADGFTGYTYSSDYSSTFSQSTTFSKDINEINFKNGRVVFILDSLVRQDFGATNSNMALAAIKVYEKGYNVAERLIRTINLHHSYFISGTNANSKRLRLDSITINGSDGLVSSKYKLEYNTSSSLPAAYVNTSANASTAKDLWGYYNGSNSQTTIPGRTIDVKPTLVGGSTTQVTIGTTGAREPNESYAQAGILKRIYFPTGGFTDFEYELNRYKDDNDNMKLAGGLRVKSISSYTGLGSDPVVKKYKYGEGESGYGRANFFIADYFFYDEQKCKYYYNEMHCATNDQPAFISSGPILSATKRRRNYFSNPTVGVSGTDGIPVVYSTVTEYIYDNVNSKSNGKTVYQFRDAVDHFYGFSGSLAFVVSNAINRGQLLKKTIYKNSGSSSFQKVQETENVYNATSLDGLQGRFGGLLLHKNNVTENVYDITMGYWPPTETIASDDWTYYNIYYETDDNYLTRTITRNYDELDEGVYLSDTVSFEYNNIIHQQPSIITYSNSNGEPIKVYNKYPADYIQPGSSYTGNGILDSLLSYNMQTSVVEKWKTIKHGALEFTTAGFVNKYQQLPNDKIVLKEQDRLKVQEGNTSFIQSHINSGSLEIDPNYEAKVHYGNYDEYANPTQVNIDGDIPETILWGYRGEYPVAKIVGATYNEVEPYLDQEILDFPANDGVLLNHLNAIRSSLPATHVSAYTFSPLTGMTSETAPNGRAIYFWYDNIGRLSIVVDNEGKL
ncbi:hypothetical protein COR50_10220 [Chitinophaga caeni]|uniref:Sugar-binding protein n=2 Tax=Chitinophaga caeni TaxID=2029983 RepID=A0A291QUH0_9BACT|nr:hypothetical protein COR50_10220 [Chitinophaga caeni]